MTSPQSPTPAIRIVPHLEGSRLLHFDIIERELPEGVVLKIGRFTDKANVPNRVTFKSKVVSRGHAEIWNERGKYFIRDTKSSSGTFLNHVRLSAPNQESKPFPLKDGDVVQLGVDYQGGTEEIYRCVKMRVEIGRSWQRQVNPFSLNALKQFRQLTGPDAFKHQNTDCCICLCGIGPCQALFLAPCSHVYHYKCIRPLLVNHHPGFLCPICRSFADLEASCEVTIDWEQLLAAQEAEEAAATSKGSAEEASKGATAEEETPQTPAPTKETTETYKEPATPHVDPCDRQETLDCTTSGGLLTPPLSEAPAEMPEDIVEFAGYRFTRQQWMELNDAVASARMLPSASPVAHSNFIPDADENLLSSTLTVRGSPHNMTEAAGPVLGEVVEDVDAEEAGSSSSTSSSPRRRHNNGLRIGNSSSSSSSASASDTEDGVLVSRPPLVDASGLNTLGMVSIPKRQQQRHDDTLNVVSPCSISTTLDDFDAVDVRVNTKGKNVERMRGGEEDVV